MIHTINSLTINPPPVPDVNIIVFQNIIFKLFQAFLGKCCFESCFRVWTWNCQIRFCITVATWENAKFYRKRFTLTSLRNDHLASLRLIRLTLRLNCGASGIPLGSRQLQAVVRFPDNIITSYTRLVGAQFVVSLCLRPKWRISLDSHRYDISGDRRMVPSGLVTIRGVQLDLFRFGLERARLELFLFFSDPGGRIFCIRSYKPSDFLISALVTIGSLLSRRRSNAIWRSAISSK